ncbi:MAG: hypothetical protein H0X37_23365 [Herpetosiphonaceae bacterium]|nr:hypothetical protein [Herpetosiphonaceae bacterium]
MDASMDLVEQCRRLVDEWLWRSAGRDAPRSVAPPHAAEQQETTLEDHLLTTSALICCLAYDREERDLLRLAALVHDLPNEECKRVVGDRLPQIDGWVELLRQQGEQLDAGRETAIPTDDSVERLLLLAHLAASRRRTIKRREEFEGHPLKAGSAVDLVYGGATKIKGYVFESAKLPEIRGASALLDSINRLDLPALWGQLPHEPSDAERRRHGDVQTQEAFKLVAPECVLYASGGNILALAPAGQGQRLATAIERRYTGDTLVANSVAVAQSFSLLELQYGRHAARFWDDDVETLFAHGSSSAKALVTNCRGQQGQSGKGFGELVTVLAASAHRRRAGHGHDTGEPRFPALVELMSDDQKCGSCDVRPATKTVSIGESTALFCEPCVRKRAAGRWAKKGGEQAGDLSHQYPWLRSWGEWLEKRAGVQVEKTANDLAEIGAAAGSSKGFVGLIYADGNNVGAAVAKLASISGYRRFAQHMLEANEAAVAAALVRHVQPKVAAAGQWPFEVITIGGDDVLLFVPADVALAVAADIAEQFEDRMRQHGITLSAGVLLMPENTPVRFANNLVVQLLNTAKKLAKQPAGVPTGSTIDFMALKSVTMISGQVEAYQAAAFQRAAQSKARVPKPALSLTQRPYTVPNLRALLAACKELKQASFPRSQLYQLRDIIQHGHLLQSMIDYRYFIERGKGRRASKHDQAYVSFEQRLKQLCGDEWLPWREHKPQSTVGGKQEGTSSYDTPLLDLIELYPFVAAEEGGIA